MSNSVKHHSITTKSNQLLRSELHQRLMPDELMLTAFGKLNPSVNERTTYFFDLWMDSNKNVLKLSDRGKLIREIFDKHCRDLGLLPLWDYQIKGVEVRFLRADDLAMVKLGWKDGR